MKTREGITFSLKKFPSYKLRVIVEGQKKTPDTPTKTTDLRTNIYCDSEDREAIERILTTNREKDGFQNLKIVHWATKTQDDTTNEFIGEWLRK